MTADRHPPVIADPHAPPSRTCHAPVIADLPRAATRMKAMRRYPTLAGLLALGAVLAAASGGQRSAPSPVNMRPTPRALLSLCASNSLLRPMCPRQVPASGSHRPDSPGYYCMTRNPRQSARETVTSFRTKRCVFAEWSYEAGEGLPGWTQATRLTGWNGRKWVADEWSMLPPPVHVGVDVQAALRSSPQSVTAGPRGAWPHRRERVSDVLLGPAARAATLGWVNWYGKRGELLLTPWGPCETGNELIFYIPPDRNGVSYSVRLDAWLGTVHLSGKRVNRTIRVQTGPALARVVATLKAIVGSALMQRGTAGSRR